jgi:hypothetical protein
VLDRYLPKVPFFERPQGEQDDDDESFDEDFSDPHDRYLGGVVPLELLVARSDTAAIAIRNLVAFADGFEFNLKVWVRNPPRRRPGRRRPRFHGPILLELYDVADGEELPGEFLRFGIEFPDGARITNLDESPWSLSPDATEPAHGMESRSGGGSDAEYEQEYWVWPLPTRGTLSFVCEWPAYDIAETRVDIDAQLVIDAADRAQPVWPDLDAGRSHMSRAAMFQHMRSARAETTESDDD